MADPGIGIPKEARSGCSSVCIGWIRAAPQDGGDGLGLAIVKNITQLYSGSRHPRERARSGTTLTLGVPSR